jgi:hypothetical protein
VENSVVTEVPNAGAAQQRGTREPCWWVALPPAPEAAAALLVRAFDSAYAEALAREILRRLLSDAETRSQKTAASSGDTTP